MPTYLIDGGISVDIETMPDAELEATLTAEKSIRATYARICKTAPADSDLHKIYETRDKQVEMLKEEVKRRNKKILIEKADENSTTG
jgi:hypothetical protein